MNFDETNPRVASQPIDYVTPLTQAEAARRRTPVVEYFSLACFIGQILCYAGGYLGTTFDPSAHQEWGGLGYLLLMYLVPLMLAPLGMLLGLIIASATRWRSVPGVAGFVLNSGVVAIWFFNRFGA